MTEQEWMDCTDPTPMLEFLGDKASDRKLRLFAVACCRRVWHLINHPDSRRGVEVTEQYADGVATWEAFQRAAHDAQEVMFADYGMCWKAAWLASSSDPWLAASEVSRWGEWDWLDETQGSLTADALVADFANILRCIAGATFRPVSLNPAWLAWNDATIPKLAQAIYDDRAFDRLPILADALEEAGCDNADLLVHCRGPGPHVRGCWAVDVILGRE